MMQMHVRYAELDVWGNQGLVQYVLRTEYRQYDASKGGDGDVKMPRNMW